MKTSMCTMLLDASFNNDQPNRKRAMPPTVSGASPQEETYPLRKAIELAYAQLDRKPPNLMTALRWARKGKFGVRLETRRFEGRYETSTESVYRFLEQVNRVAEPRSSTENRRERELLKISVELDILLGGRH